MTHEITWNNGRGGHLVGALTDLSIEDLMAGVEALGAKNDACPDGRYENFFRYTGTFRGVGFCLYDSSYAIHIGSTDALDVPAFVAALTALLGAGRASGLSPETLVQIAVAVDGIVNN
jgi:hypothetical protein